MSTDHKEIAGGILIAHCDIFSANSVKVMKNIYSFMARQKEYYYYVIENNTKFANIILCLSKYITIF